MVILGKKYKDNISGFSGIATGRTEYLYGCVRVLIESDKLSKDGEPYSEFWFDEQRLTFVKSKTKAKTAGNSGGPRTNPIRQKDPLR